jgi:hypothetical protein
MLRRLILGLVVGLMVGAALAVGLARLIGPTFAVPGGPFVAFGAAAVAGALTGMVAGKPFWAEGAKVEAGLKASFGALLGAAAMFALRRWGIEIPAPPALGGTAPIGQLTEVSVPLIAAVLGALFGLDNVPDATPRDPPAGVRKRVVSGAQMKRAPGAEPDEADAEIDPHRARR